MRRNFLMVVLAVLLLVGLGSAAGAAPARVVSLVPSITENIYVLGAQDQLVGVTSWCNYPPEAQEKTVVGDAFNLNMEILLSLEPDLVLGDANLVSHHLQSLADLDIPVFTIQPLTYDEVAESLVLLGEVLGHADAGEAAAANMRRRREELLDQVPEDAEVSVFVETWNEPISTAGPGSFLHELITMAGAHNIAHDMDEPWGQFSEELIIDRNPDVILLTNFNYDEVMARSSWQQLTAVRDGRVVEVNPDIFSRTSPRLADALEALITILYSR